MTVLYIIIAIIGVSLAAGLYKLIKHLRQKDSFYYLNPVRGSRYDPEIVEKSGGMSGFSTFPVDTSPYGGYVNYPYTYQYYPTSLMYPYYRHPYFRRYHNYSRRPLWRRRGMIRRRGMRRRRRRM